MLAESKTGWYDTDIMSEYNLALHKPMPDHKQKVFQGDIFTVWNWEQELYDGTTMTFERATRTDVTHAVGILPDGRILLTEDTQPHREAVITPPGGKVEDGETPEETVRREFMEETGYEIGELLPWHHYKPTNDKIEYVCWAFVGRDVKKVAEPSPEGGEKIKVLFYSFDEFLELGKNPKMRDWIIRIILLEALLDNKKRDKLKKLFYG